MEQVLFTILLNLGDKYPLATYCCKPCNIFIRPPRFSDLLPSLKFFVGKLSFELKFEPRPTACLQIPYLGQTFYEFAITKTYTFNN